jgi:hypothetical protein
MSPLLRFFSLKIMASITVSVILLTAPTFLHAQIASAYVSTSSAEQADLPDAPSAAQQSPDSTVPFQTPRGNRPLQPANLRSKFQYLVEPAFGPRSFINNAFDAGIRMANPPDHYPHDWHAGAEAFGRLYGDSFARNGAQSIGSFSTAVLLHEDPRYQRSASTSAPTRLGHALLYTFVDRTDGGHPTLALSNFTGAAANGFIGNAYLPAGFDNLTHAGQRSTIAFGGIAAQNVLQEFSPEIGHALMKIHLPHIPLPPVWWTGDKQ